jgi:hypothetical protein
MVRGRFMPSFWTDGTSFSYSYHVHPAPTDFTDEICATVARVFAYVGTLALFGILGVHLWSQYDAMKAAGPAALTGWAAGWNVSGRSHPAFAVSQVDQPYKSATYTILRRPEGGRKDILRWTDATERQVMELEIYRPGGEWDVSSPASTDLAARMQQIGASGLEAAGIVQSKFGTVALLRPIVRPEAKEGAEACLGFFKRIDDPGLRISGWSCQGDNWPAKRAAIGCMLNRLTLLTSGNEPKLAELFARAELKHGSCGADPSDWVTGIENPKLRGTLLSPISP